MPSVAQNHDIGCHGFEGTVAPKEDPDDQANRRSTAYPRVWGAEIDEGHTILAMGAGPPGTRDGVPHGHRRNGRRTAPDPVWGAWVNDRWYVEGGPTRWKRNLGENPQLAINVEFGDEVVVVEGRAREVSMLGPAEIGAMLAGYAKYKSIGYEAEAANWTGGGLWELEPVKAFAWSSFPKDITRFTF